MQMKGGDSMGYSVKWVVDNLGITRDMLRYYEKEKLLAIDETRNPSNRYRDYSEDDIERIWGIRLLIGIGFSTKEIYAFGNDPNFNFYNAISEKVEQLEKKLNEIQIYWEFAKTIKMTGRIPNTTHYGNMKFDDFIEYSRQNWNAFNEPQSKKLIEMTDTILNKSADEWNETDFNRMMGALGDIEPEQMAQLLTMDGYYRVIVNMMHLGYDSDVVQAVVKCLYEYFLSNIPSEHRDKFTPLYFANSTISTLIDSDLAKLNERNHGKDGCVFIAKAIACFSGYDIDI